MTHLVANLFRSKRREIVDAESGRGIYDRKVTLPRVLFQVSNSSLWKLPPLVPHPRKPGP